MIGSLFALTGLRQFFVEPLADATSNAIWFGLQIAPLLAVLPGVLRLKHRSCFLAALVATLYFVHGVLLVVDADSATMGFWEVGFSLVLVFTATHLARLTRPDLQPR